MVTFLLAWWLELLALLGAYRVYRFVVLSAPAAWCRILVRRGRRERMPDWKHAIVWTVALGRCRSCGRWLWPGEAQTDHWHRAHVDGGSNSLVNLANLGGPTACACNQRKHTTPARRLHLRLTGVK